jgi:hypothetical protein
MVRVSYPLGCYYRYVRRGLSCYFFSLPGVNFYDWHTAASATGFNYPLGTYYRTYYQKLNISGCP